MSNEKAKISSFDEEEPRIVLPIPYEDEAAEEARARAAAEKEKAAKLAAFKSNAPIIGSMGYSQDDSAELMRKKQEAEAARKEYEAALAKLKEAEAVKESFASQAAAAAAIKLAAEEAQKAAENAVVDFDANGNSIVKITVPKNYDVVINFKPKNV